MGSSLLSYLLRPSERYSQDRVVQPPIVALSHQSACLGTLPSIALGDSAPYRELAHNVSI